GLLASDARAVRCDTAGAGKPAPVFFLFVGRFPEGQIFLLFSSGNGFSPLIFQGFLSKLRAGSFA
ncbi:MAG TPA: hypothetical protein VLX60_06490, partial [Terriglobales bacterium]|nr:hypothetical protein [Terriglobales bacterium]